MAVDNIPPAVLESVLAASAIATQAAIPSEVQQAIQQSLLAVLQVAEAEAANSNAQLAAANCTAQAWQDNCATMQQALTTATDLTNQAQAVAATALQDAAAARDEAAVANIRATLADQATAAATSMLSVLLHFTGQLLQLTVLLAAAFLGRFLPLQLLALLPFAKWAELVHLFMCTSDDERQSFSWHLMCYQSTAEALTAIKHGTVGLLQQHIPIMPLQLLRDLYDSSPVSTHLLLQAQQRVSVLPKSAQEAWQHAAAHCCTIQQISALISLACSLTSKPLYTAIGCFDTPLLLEAAAAHGACMPPALEAAAVAEKGLPYQQHAGSIHTALCSPGSAHHSLFCRPVLISHASCLLILPAPEPPTCSLSALITCSSTTSNAHWANAAAVSSHSHTAFREPPQHTASSADAVVHVIVVHSFKSNSSNHSSMASKAISSGLSSLTAASSGYSRTADSIAAEALASNMRSSLHHGSQAAATTGAAMYGFYSLISPTSSSSALHNTAEGTSNPRSSSSHGSHTRFSGLIQLFKQTRSSCLNKSSSSSSQGGINASGRPAGQVVCTQDTSQQGYTNACPTGCSSSSSGGSSLVMCGMKSSGFKLRAAFKGFLHRQHKDTGSSSSAPSCQDAQCRRPCNAALAGQGDAAAADVALLSCPDGNKQSSSSTTSTRPGSNTSSNYCKHASCAGGGQQSSARASEEGFSDAAASSVLKTKHVQHQQRQQQSLGKQQQQRLRSTAARLRAAWQTDRHLSRSLCADTDHSARG